MRALIDTSALLALARTRDQYHGRAVGIAEGHLGRGGRYVGTTLILGELHAHLVHLRGPVDARAQIRRLLVDPIHEWVQVGPDLLTEALDHWLEKFDDQDFTLADAVSFEVMRREGLRRAFAFDRHFEVAGFELME
jgi:predicted nucleic acid-binding protein